MAFQRIFELNTRLWLAELAAAHGWPTPSLALVPQRLIQQWRRWQIDAIWLMGVWEPSPYGRRFAQEHAEVVLSCQHSLPDICLDDCGSSPYAVHRYVVSQHLGGLQGLLQFRQRLKDVGIGLILDFVPNHTACDHPWVYEHPEHYVQGTVEQARQTPRAFFPVQSVDGLRFIAHGRDPYFDPWTDTAQLDYSNLTLHAAMQAELLRVAQWCDGVRCDMAMLCLADVFVQTWSRLSLPQPPREFWREAVHAVRAQFPNFCFIAEVYWGLEERLQSLGFNLCYDKEFYDALLHKEAAKLHSSVQTSRPGMEGRLRFLENHDEPRAADRLSEVQQEAAALAILTLPGSVLLHEGQFQGWRAHHPVQLQRRAPEPNNPHLQAFYDQLLSMTLLRHGVFYPLHPAPAWNSSTTHRNFLAWAWAHDTERLLVVINYSDCTSQCYLNLAEIPLAAERLRFHDLLHDISYMRSRHDVQQQGMYFEMPSFGTHLFTVQAAHEA